MSRTITRAFIQARMSSARFPGKVLAPFHGRPMIAHVIAQVARVIPSERIVVATSGEQSDDPLACYVREIGISVFRGNLDNVVERFRLCLREHPCTWFFRISADSPLLDTGLLQTMLGYSARSAVDLVTNVFPRTFPKGRSVEMIYSPTFAGFDLGRLTVDEREHVTKVYYNHPDEFKIVNIESEDRSLAMADLAVDTVDDLQRLEKLLNGSSLCSTPGP